MAYDSKQLSLVPTKNKNSDADISNLDKPFNLKGHKTSKQL